MGLFDSVKMNLFCVYCGDPMQDGWFQTKSGNGAMMHYKSLEDLGDECPSQRRFSFTCACVACKREFSVELNNPSELARLYWEKRKTG